MDVISISDSFAETSSMTPSVGICEWKFVTKKPGDAFSHTGNGVGAVVGLRLGGTVGVFVGFNDGLLVGRNEGVSVTGALVTSVVVGVDEGENVGLEVDGEADTGTSVGPAEAGALVTGAVETGDVVGRELGSFVSGE
mmetsp:Transcript_14687/g.32739  ORF Transcript_14687/g.32739 Transcript_14687/m.32739 type:complete len:138 (-) Transcript_14687:2614-3027(-)